MAEIKTLLDDVIETELANLRTLPSGNEERAKAIPGSGGAAQAAYRGDQGPGRRG